MSPAVEPQLAQPATPIDQMFAALTLVPTLLLNSSLCIIQVSASYLALNKLTSEECTGRDIYEFVQARGLVPQAAAFRDAIEVVVATQKVYATTDIEAADHTFWSLRAVPILEKDKLFYLALEVQNTTTERQKLLYDQLDTNHTYRILVETVKDYAIFMLDTKGNVKTWNTGATLLKGYQPTEIIGRHFSTFYTEEDIATEKPRNELEVCLREGRVEDESWRCRKDGSRFWANVVITALYRDGIHIGFSKVTRDLSERKTAESCLISAYEESAKLKSAFLANMSHEIRTPMHGMLSALTLLMDSSLSPVQRELGGIIEESGSVMLQVINNVLDYSKLASGALLISSDVINIRDIITSVLRASRIALKPSICLRTFLDPHLPDSAQGDSLRYRQILQNLVGNATKFTESGYIQVTTTIKQDDDTSYTVLTEVTDTGIGIPMSETGSLFKPFTQIDTSATKRYQGTGLGLSICKNLAKLMGGAVGFHSNPDSHGSVFWFTTKLGKLSESEPLNSLGNGLQSVTLSSPLDPLLAVRGIAPGKRLLLVEDNFINQKVMLMILKSLGFEKVDTATDGAEAVQLIKQIPQAYDLILMDINMPVLDGLGATVEIRKAGLNIPIIAMTANALKGVVDECLAEGMDDYIPKPVDRQLLSKVLLNWLK